MTQSKLTASTVLSKLLPEAAANASPSERPWVFLNWHFLSCLSHLQSPFYKRPIENKCQHLWKCDCFLCYVLCKSPAHNFMIWRWVSYHFLFFPCPSHKVIIFLSLLSCSAPKWSRVSSSKQVTLLPKIYFPHIIAPWPFCFWSTKSHWINILNSSNVSVLIMWHSQTITNIRIDLSIWMYARTWQVCKCARVHASICVCACVRVNTWHVCKCAHVYASTCVCLLRASEYVASM